MDSKKYLKEIIYSETDIKKSISDLAKWINSTYKNSKDLVIIVTMLGAVPFAMDIIKEIEIIHALDFIGVKSYFGKSKQTDIVMINKDIDIDIKNKEVIVLEDIVDSGRTLQKLLDLLNSREPKNLQVVSLLKREVNNVEIGNLKFSIEVPQGLFLVGYGLDYNNKYRNLKDIGILKNNLLKKDDK